jgi:hypothetical protein
MRNGLQWQYGLSLLHVPHRSQTWARAQIAIERRNSEASRTLVKCSLGDSSSAGACTFTDAEEEGGGEGGGGEAGADCASDARGGGGSLADCASIVPAIADQPPGRT